MPDEKQFPPLTDHQIAVTMLHYGGGFVKAIANAWFHGDSLNKPRVRAAFPEYWELYDRLTYRCPECGETEIDYHDGDYKQCEKCEHKFDFTDKETM